MCVQAVSARAVVTVSPDTPVVTTGPAAARWCRPRSVPVSPCLASHLSDRSPCDGVTRQTGHTVMTSPLHTRQTGHPVMASSLHSSDRSPCDGVTRQTDHPVMASPLGTLQTGHHVMASPLDRSPCDSVIGRHPSDRSPCGGVAPTVPSDRSPCDGVISRPVHDR